MRALSVLFPHLCFVTALAAADTVKPSVDEAGRWHLPFRYWSHHTPYESAESYAFLAEVIKLGPEVPPPDRQRGPLKFRNGILKVGELLHPKTGKVTELSKVRELAVDGVDGLKLGDQVVVFVDPEPYEGSYAINYHEGSCLIGIRLPVVNDAAVGDVFAEPILKTLREGRTSLRQLSSVELSAWIAVDPTGIARQFQMELDLERLEWKKPAP